MYKDFFTALAETQLIKLTFESRNEGLLTRTCAPMDFGPSQIYSSSSVRYHFIDLDSSSGSHPLSLEPEQIRAMEVLEERFSPESLVHWKPNWFFSRDWGQYS